MLLRTAVLTLALVACACAHAAGTGDDLDSFLVSKGLATPTAATPTSPSTTANLPLDFAPMARQPQPAETTEAPAPRALTDRMSELVVSAMGAIGIPYRRGGNSYEAGFDCSGFVRAVYNQTLGLLLPRQAAQQAAATQTIDRDQLQPGDLVFFNTLRRDYSHVGIYVGDHKFIHSPKPGAAVRIEDMRMNYWNRRFDGARRVAEADTSTSPAQLSSYGNLH
jgi:cell wall-associated NlpC family hydrolase